MKIKNLKFEIIGIITFAIFVIFSILVSFGTLANIDYSATIILQNLIPGVFITPFSTFSILGTAEFTGIILLILLFLFVKYKKIYILALFILVGLIEIAGKTFIHQAGPPLYFLKTNLSLGLPVEGVAHDFFAYPSGHSARTAFISGFLLILIWLSPKLSRNLKITFAVCILIFDFIMFLSRVYLGEHWVSDVVGGMLLGFSLAFFTSYFLSSKSLN